MPNVRKTGGRNELDAIWNLLNGLVYARWSSESDASFAAGGAAGKLQNLATASYFINGIPYSKVATDNLWDLSAEVNTTATKYRAYWLYLDDAGAGSIVAGTDELTEELAMSTLPTIDDTQSIIGVYVAYPSCNFAGALDLAGTTGQIYPRVPNGVPLMVTLPDLTTPVSA